tara:strand:+ start:105 stop:251 length:147 start_codon:yes stop_codon:yes gene_type:complete
VYKTKQFKIETPVGSIESDSGSHIVDVASVFIGVIFVYIVAKKIKDLL